MNHRHHTSHTGHTGLESWVTEVAAHTTSDEIVWCDGSQGEWDRLTGELIRKGTFVRLNPELRPNSFLARSDPSDVARVEDSTLRGHLAGAMRGRTMYVVPFSMGRLGSPISQLGVQITYSAYVVVSMKIMTRMGKQALDLIEQSDGFVKALHSVGAPPAARPHRRDRRRRRLPDRAAARAVRPRPRRTVARPKRISRDCCGSTLWSGRPRQTPSPVTSWPSTGSPAAVGPSAAAASGPCRPAVRGAGRPPSGRVSAMVLDTLAHNPLLVLFLVAASGYLFGRISIHGFRLGVRRRTLRPASPPGRWTHG